MSVSEEEIQELRTALKRCSPETIEAAVRFRHERNPDDLPLIVYGIIERYLPPENPQKLSECEDSTRLVEDLGIDSLTMLEIVMSIEEAVGIRVENEELREIATLGEVKAFIGKKIAGESGGAKQATATRRLDRLELATLLPHQPPFFFLDDAEIEGPVIRASYAIRGDEFFLEGHFRNNPVFPASIVFEALGQAACAWLYVNVPAMENQTINSDEMLFASLEGAHFYRKALPGETLRLEARMVRIRPPLGIFSGSVTINGEKVAEVERLMLAFAPEASVLEAGAVGEAIDAERATKGSDGSVAAPDEVPDETAESAAGEKPPLP